MSNPWESIDDSPEPDKKKAAKSKVEKKPEKVVKPKLVKEELVSTSEPFYPDPNDPWSMPSTEVPSPPVAEEESEPPVKDAMVQQMARDTVFDQEQARINAEEDVVFGKQVGSYMVTGICMCCDKYKNNISGGTGCCYECDEEPEMKKSDAIMEAVKESREDDLVEMELPKTAKQADEFMAYMGNVRCLFVLQPSSIKGGKKFVLDGDSNWNMYLRGIIPELIKHRFWHFYITVPDPKDVYGAPKDADESYFYELIHPKIRDDPDFRKHITFIVAPYERNAFMSRFMFDTTFWRGFFKQYTDFDAVWCNYPELLRNLKTVMMASGLNGPKSITSFYWVDNKFHRRINDDCSYSFRQIDGAITADIPQFAAKATYEDFLEGMKEFHNEHAIMTVEEKAKVWDFGASRTEILEHPELRSKSQRTMRDRRPYEEINDGKFVFLFPNRMRSYTNFKKFIELMNKLYKKRQDFVAIMTAPDLNKSQEALKKLCKPLIIVKNETRLDYLKILHRADFVVSMFRKELYGGCATREAMVAGAMPLMYKEIAWKDMFQDDYPGFLPINMKKMVDQVDKILDSPRFVKKGRAMTAKVINSFCYEDIVIQVAQDIMEQFQFSENDVKWAGYVYDAIKQAHDFKVKRHKLQGIPKDVQLELWKAIGDSTDISYPITKKHLNALLFARSKSDLMIAKGETKANHWPFGNKDWFSKIRWALFERFNIIDDTSSPHATYRLGATELAKKEA